MMLPSWLYFTLATAVVQGADHIITKGSKFFNKRTGDQFYIKGIAYHPGGSGHGLDPLASPENCRRDLPYFKELGVNVLRVYEAYPDKNHDECMKLFDANNIYVILDLPVPKASINREFPSYDPDLLNHFQRKIDMFSKYDNLLAFIAGNEVANNPSTTHSAAYVKASLRDAKAHIRARAPRPIPVGYADNDDGAIRASVQAYFNCGPQNERADFYAINIYRWCGKATFESSGYDRLKRELMTSDVPTFLSEYGCNSPRERQFDEVLSIYGKDMGQVLSGGIAFEYSEEPNSFGVVNIDGSRVTKRADFAALADKLHRVKPNGASLSSYRPTPSPRHDCPPVADTWKSHGTLPPTPNRDACACAFQSLTCHATVASLDPGNGETVGKQLGYQCERGNCNLIEGLPQLGRYGKFATCPLRVKNSLIYSTAVQKDGAACAFDGFAQANPAPSGDTPQSCLAKYPDPTSPAKVPEPQPQPQTKPGPDPKPKPKPKSVRCRAANQNLIASR